MNWSVMFFFNSILFGVGLAMDAFSVSLANGLRYPQMKGRDMCRIAGTFGVFQTAMPLLGWLCVHTVATAFRAVDRFIPLVALLLLAYIGGHMIWEGLHHRAEEEAEAAVGLRSLLLQGLATSIDALSVGFTIEQYNFSTANVVSLLIGGVTFALCMVALLIGKRLGTKISRYASILGGVILVGIGFKIFLGGLG